LFQKRADTRRTGIGSFAFRAEQSAMNPPVLVGGIDGFPWFDHLPDMSIPVVPEASKSFKMLFFAFHQHRYIRCRQRPHHGVHREDSILTGITVIQR
jgi:hypothetical protein